MERYFLSVLKVLSYFIEFLSCFYQYLIDPSEFSFLYDISVTCNICQPVDIAFCVPHIYFFAMFFHLSFSGS